MLQVEHQPAGPLHWPQEYTLKRKDHEKLAGHPFPLPTPSLCPCSPTGRCDCTVHVFTAVDRGLAGSHPSVHTACPLWPPWDNPESLQCWILCLASIACFNLLASKWITSPVISPLIWFIKHFRKCLFEAGAVGQWVKLLLRTLVPHMSTSLNPNCSISDPARC